MSHKHTLTKGKAAFLEYYSKQLPQFSIPELTTYLNTRNTPVLLISRIFETKLNRYPRLYRRGAPAKWKYAKDRITHRQTVSFKQKINNFKLAVVHRRFRYSI